MTHQSFSLGTFGVSDVIQIRRDRSIVSPADVERKKSRNRTSKAVFSAAQMDNARSVTKILISPTIDTHYSGFIAPSSLRGTPGSDLRCQGVSRTAHWFGGVTGARKNLETWDNGSR